MVLFLAKRYCTDEAVAHEAFHAVVALWWRLFRRMAKSGDRHDTNEAIALRIGRLVKRLHQFRAQFYGGKP